MFCLIVIIVKLWNLLIIEYYTAIDLHWEKINKGKFLCYNDCKKQKIKLSNCIILLGKIQRKCIKYKLYIFCIAKLWAVFNF